MQVCGLRGVYKAFLAAEVDGSVLVGLEDEGLARLGVVGVEEKQKFYAERERALGGVGTEQLRGFWNSSSAS